MKSPMILCCFFIRRITPKIEAPPISWWQWTQPAVDTQDTPGTEKILPLPHSPSLSRLLRRRYFLCAHLFKKALPKALSFLKGFLGSTTRAFPGIIPSTSPCITAMKESVVGSGPILMPGKSCSSRYLAKVNTVLRDAVHEPGMRRMRVPGGVEPQNLAGEVGL